MIGGVVCVRNNRVAMSGSTFDIRFYFDNLVRGTTVFRVRTRANSCSNETSRNIPGYSATAKLDRETRKVIFIVTIYHIGRIADSGFKRARYATRVVFVLFLGETTRFVRNFFQTPFITLPKRISRTRVLSLHPYRDNVPHEFPHCFPIALYA